MSSAFKIGADMATLPQVSLAKVDLTVYPNARNHNAIDYESAIESMHDSIKSEGLISPPALASHGDGKAAVAGFTRILAMTTLALEPLAQAANKGPDGTALKRTDEKFINIFSEDGRKRLRELDSAAYDKALAETMIPYTPKTVENAQDARILNGIENFVRNDMSPRETALMFHTILTDKENPIKAKTLAIKFGASEGKISQYRKLAEFETTLPEYLTTPQEGESFTEDQLAQLKTTVKILMDDYKRRLSINLGNRDERKNKDAEQAIPFIHAREFANKVVTVAGRKPLSRAVALTVFKKLLGWSEIQGMLDPDRQTPDFSVFQQQMENAVKAAGEKPEAVSADTATAAGAVGAAGAVDTTAVTGAGGAGVTGGAVPPVTPAGVTQTPVTTTVGAAGTANAAPAGSAVAQQMEAATANATAGVAGASADDILDAGGEESGAGAGDTAGTAAAPAPTRQVKAGQAPPVKEKYAKAKEYIEMDKYCDTLLDCAAEEGNRFGDTAGYLGGAAVLYECLGMVDEQKEVETAMDAFAESCDAYVTALEKIRDAAIKASLPVKGVDMKKLARPVFSVSDEDGDEAEAEAVAAG